jgi:hypothetical protein
VLLPGWRLAQVTCAQLIAAQWPFRPLLQMGPLVPGLHGRTDPGSVSMAPRPQAIALPQGRESSNGKEHPRKNGTRELDPRAIARAACRGEKSLIFTNPRLHNEVS